MITPGKQKIIPCYDLNSELLKIEKEMNEQEAKDTLAQFLIHNAHHYTWEFLTNIALFTYQCILLKSWILKNFSMNIVSRGGAKSYLMAVFSALYSIIHPGTKIVICSSGFRRARAILEQVDKFLKSKEAIFLKQCFPLELRRRNDEYKIDINDGFITALPLSSSSTLRGQRADVVLFDEGLLCPEEVWNEQIKPFLVARSGIQELLKIRKIEDWLIEQGMLKEENREFLETTKKIIVCSSASYKFEFLSRWFDSWVEMILSGKKNEEGLEGSYFVSRISYEALPIELIDTAIINEAKNSSMSDSTFQREYMAVFTDDSSGFFSAKKMAECTIAPGQNPSAKIKGEPNKSYIISIDTSWSESKSSDHFAMSVLELDYENKIVTLVHPYAKAGDSFKNNATYLYYLLTNFNVTAIITDKSGGGMKFIESANELSIFKENNLKLNKWEVDFDAENITEVMRTAKLNYNLQAKKIVYGQAFTADTIGKMNDNLQFYIDRKKVWFASLLSSHDNILDSARKEVPEYLLQDKTDKGRAIEDFIDDIDDNIVLTKSEASLIEVSVSPLGKRQFDLPQHIKRSDSPNRPRKDSYTALLMGCWMAKCLFDMAEIKEEVQTVTPIFIG